jgi:hypothetical protein
VQRGDDPHAAVAGGFDAADFERIKADRINYLQSVLRATDDENLAKVHAERPVFGAIPIDLAFRERVHD